jgi:hypothetical protein
MFVVAVVDSIDLYGASGGFVLNCFNFGYKRQSVTDVRPKF